MERSLWGHLPLLMRSNSKESVEYILQALWRTRKSGLDSADRHIVRDMLQLENDSDLDPLLLQNDAQSYSGELDVNFQFAQDTLEVMLSSMYSIRDQLSNMDETSTRHLSQETNVV